jgi:hypothetical protein
MNPAVRAFTLDGAADRTEVSPRDAIGLANEGAVVQLEGALGHLGFLQQFEDLYVDAIAQVAPPEAVSHVRQHGLQRMHDVLTPAVIAELLPVLDRQAKRFAVPVATAMVQLASRDARDYFICNRTWVRAQVPYRLVADDAEIMSMGHLSGHLVPTTPHRDVDLTHPRGTLSMWSAVAPIGRDNSIEVFDVARPPFAASPDHPDARSAIPVLAPGDVVIFDADRLHTSVVNVSEDTRVSVGTRVVFGRALHYGPGTHWRPFYDARLLDSRLEPLATLQSRCSAAALRRWRWRRARAREQERARRSTLLESGR